MRKILAILLLGLVGVNSGYAESPLTANIGVTSNYIWRGATQGGDDSAISGGIDYAHGSGFYAGTWTSSLGGGDQYEQDLYVGYSGKVGSLSYDVSYIMYTYPVGDAVEDDFEELILSVGFGPVTFTYAPTLGKESGINEDDIYMSLAVEFEVKKDLVLGLLYGSYDVDGGSANDYAHYQISLGKGDFVVAYDVKDPETEDPSGVEDAPRFTVSWSKSFDL